MRQGLGGPALPAKRDGPNRVGDVLDFDESGVGRSGAEQAERRGVSEDAVSKVGDEYAPLLS